MRGPIGPELGFPAAQETANDADTELHIEDTIQLDREAAAVGTGHGWASPLVTRYSHVPPLVRRRFRWQEIARHRLMALRDEGIPHNA